LDSHSDAELDNMFLLGFLHHLDDNGIQLCTTWKYSTVEVGS